MKIVQISNEEMKERISSNKLYNIYWIGNFPNIKVYEIEMLQVRSLLRHLTENDGAFVEVTDDRSKE